MKLPYLTPILERIRARRRLARVLGAVGISLGSAAISAILYLLIITVSQGTARDAFGLYGWFTLACFGLAALAGSCLLTTTWPRRIAWYGLLGAAGLLFIASISRG